MTDYRNGGVCRAGVWPGQMIGVPCANCGHTDLVHPGGHNPAVAECLLCALEDTIAQFTPPPGVTLTITRIEGKKDEDSS